MQRHAKLRTAIRRFDDGDTFAIYFEASPARVFDGVLVSTSVCAEPSCGCRDVHLDLVPAILDGDAMATAPGMPKVRAAFHVDTHDLVLGERFVGRPVEQRVVEAVRAHLAPYYELLVQRFRRARAQIDPDAWRAQNLTSFAPGVLVPYYELFPSARDLAGTDTGARYWLVDNWCVTPDCPCEDVTLGVLPAATEGGREIGAARVDTRNGRILAVNGDPRVRSIVCAFLADAEHPRELRRRHRTTRAIAAQLPVGSGQASGAPPPIPARTPTTRGGRNDPCECGSGKKRKRCCGR